MAAKTHTDPDRLYRLGLGCFAVKVGKGIAPPTCLLQIPTFLLEDSNAMAAADWEALTEQQLRASYKPVQDWEGSPPPAVAAGADPAEFTPPPDAPPAAGDPPLLSGSSGCRNRRNILFKDPCQK